MLNQCLHPVISPVKQAIVKIDELAEMSWQCDMSVLLPSGHHRCAFPSSGARLASKTPAMHVQCSAMSARPAVQQQ
jgi:hypothetical protein